VATAGFKSALTEYSGSLPGGPVLSLQLVGFTMENTIIKPNLESDTHEKSEVATSDDQNSKQRRSG